MNHSLRYKIILVLIVFAFILSGFSILVSRRTLENMSEEMYCSKADELAATVARTLDPQAVVTLRDEVMEIYDASELKVSSEEWGTPEFDAYVSQFSHLEGGPVYDEIMKELRSIQEINSVDCLYLICNDLERNVSIYLLDASERNPCPVGCLDPLYDVNLEALEKDPKGGFPAYITNTPEYGWLVTASAPVLDEGGDVVGMAAVDISMDEVKHQESTFLAEMALTLLILTFLLCFIVIWYVNRSVIRPVNMLSQSAAYYADQVTHLTHRAFEELDIHTGDEIEILHKSMIQMEKDIDQYIQNLMKTKEKLSHSRKEAQMMNVLAHEDGLTRLHNRLAYDQEAQRLDQGLAEGKSAFGIAMIDMNDLKLVNDQYGHDAGNEALIKLSKIISKVFVHSLLFRIGGDEFLVILENNDYDKCEELTQVFEESIANQEVEGKPWEPVKAAIGYAIYTEGLDKCVEDVFRRADSEMYAKKKQMKVGRDFKDT